MTEEQLNLIDKIISRPGHGSYQGHVPVLCMTPHPEEDLLDDDLRNAGFVSYANLHLFRHRRQYERSMWVRTAEGRCVPEVLARAVLKYGTIDCDAYWTDGNWLNRSQDNVSLMKPVVPGTIRSKYGVRSTTAEYRKKYYSDPENKARQRKSAREYAARQRANVGQARSALPTSVLAELEERILGRPRTGDEDDRKEFEGPVDINILSADEDDEIEILGEE